MAERREGTPLSLPFVLLQSGQERRLMLGERIELEPGPTLPPDPEPAIPQTSGDLESKVANVTAFTLSLDFDNPQNGLFHIAISWADRGYIFAECKLSEDSNKVFSVSFSKAIRDQEDGKTRIRGSNIFVDEKSGRLYNNELWSLRYEPLSG